jgi:methylenetetrahydrofolate dehydrogenase (NADP+)/methenyltetrahydrofolate cyclohydrolase
VRAQVSEFTATQLRAPSLAIYLSTRAPPDSLRFVAKKQQACHVTGIECHVIKLPHEGSTAEWRAHIAHSPHDAVVVQWPVPSQIDFDTLTAAINPVQDVDAMTPVNAGTLALGQTPYHVSCSTLAVHEALVDALQQLYPEVTPVTLLPRVRCVLIGQSVMVGRPLLNWALNQNLGAISTVHRDTPLVISQQLVNAHVTDPHVIPVVISATGQPHLLVPESDVRASADKLRVADGQILIDVGFHVDTDTQQVLGDFSPRCYRTARAYTPVPGGIGPLTVALLLRNVVAAARLKLVRTD